MKQYEIYCTKDDRLKTDEVFHTDYIYDFKNRLK